MSIEMHPYERSNGYLWRNDASDYFEYSSRNAHIGANWSTSLDLPALLDGPLEQAGLVVDTRSTESSLTYTRMINGSETIEDLEGRWPDLLQGADLQTARVGIIALRKSMQTYWFSPRKRFSDRQEGPISAQIGLYTRGKSWQHIRDLARLTGPVELIDEAECFVDYWQNKQLHRYSLKAAPEQ